MDTVGRSNSPTPEEVGLHYASGYEARRHETGGGKLDAAWTQELMRRFLPSPPALVRDVGGRSRRSCAVLDKYKGFEMRVEQKKSFHSRQIFQER